KLRIQSGRLRDGDRHDMVDVGRRLTDVELVAAGVGVPPRLASLDAGARRHRGGPTAADLVPVGISRVPVRERARVENEVNGARGARVESHFGEGLELLGWAHESRRVRTDVALHDGGPG